MRVTYPTNHKTKQYPTGSSNAYVCKYHVNVKPNYDQT